MMKQLLFLFTSLFIYSATLAQGGSISGKITDTSLKKILPLATVTVFKAADTTIVTYRLSNQQGEFKVPSLPLNIPLRVMVSFSGYEAYRKDFILSAVNSSIQFDSVMLYPTYKQLDEVMVIAERPPVIIKQDTIEFNASAFKTLPNALVEDLLKKLPGVQVDADGNITVNGKPVNRLTVDGKNFFGDDPKMASRNLPANIIDKVQVVDDKEQMLRNGDDNMNNVGKVVNITLKKGIKKGWFGKLYAGGGTEDVYEAGGIANIFRDTLQVSVLGYSNNLNRPGFGLTDLTQAGGLQRNSSLTGSSSTSINNNSAGGSSISINGVNFGGSQNYGGIATSKGGGININHAPNNKNSLFAQYFYGNVLINRENNTGTSLYNGDTLINNKTVLTGDVITHGHNIGIGAKLKPDSVTTLLVTANYTIGISDELRYSSINSNHNKLGQLSYGNIAQDNKANTHYFRENITYTRLSKTKKGRRFTLLQSLDINNRVNNNTTDALTKYVYPAGYDSVLQQLRNENIPRIDAVAAFNYSEPLSKLLTVRIGSRYEYSKLNNAISTYFASSQPNNYDVFNPLLSSDFKRESNRFYINTGLEFKPVKDLTITPSLRVLWQQVDNYLLSSAKAVNQRETSWLPGLTVVYKQLNFNYSKDVALPFYTYLLPVADNSNPYFINKGNAALLPAERHNLSVGYYFNDIKKYLNIGLNGGGSFTKNDVIQSTTVNDKGVQTNMPVNANGSSNWWINYNINKQYKFKNNVSFSWNTGGYYGYNRSSLQYNGLQSWQSTWNMNQWAGFNINLNDKFEWNSYNSMRYNFTDNTNPAFAKQQVTSYFANNEIIVRYPKHVIWETGLAYDHNGNVAAGLPKDTYRLNAAINFTMLKNERGVLKISVFDLLKSNANIGMNTNRNMVTTFQTNVLPRYFMATFTYNIQTIGGAKKKVGGERLLLF